MALSGKPYENINAVCGRYVGYLESSIWCVCGKVWAWQDHGFWLVC